MQLKFNIFNTAKGMLPIDDTRLWTPHPQHYTISSQVRQQKSTYLQGSSISQGYKNYFINPSISQHHNRSRGENHTAKLCENGIL